MRQEQSESQQASVSWSALICPGGDTCVSFVTCLCCQVAVTVAASDMFEFVFPDQGGLATPFVHNVFVESQDEASVHVPIRPVVLGEVPVSVKAMTSTASDSVVRTVLVEVLVQDSQIRFWEG